MDKKILYKISQGMYILTNKKSGCCVDAVSQISGGDNPLIAVSVMKKNYTNTTMHNEDMFALSVIGLNTDYSVIKTYGFYSSLDYDKFGNSKTIEVDGIKVIDDSLGYIICKKVQEIENETHTLFIGRVIDAVNFKDDEPMTYQYYQANKDRLLNNGKRSNKTSWTCSICGYVYEGDELPDDFVCPICGVGKELFKKNN